MTPQEYMQGVTPPRSKWLYILIPVVVAVVFAVLLVGGIAWTGSTPVVLSRAILVGFLSFIMILVPGGIMALDSYTQRRNRYQRNLAESERYSPVILQMARSWKMDPMKIKMIIDEHDLLNPHPDN